MDPRYRWWRRDRTRARWRQLDHTADVGFEVEAEAVRENPAGEAPATGATGAAGATGATGAVRAADAMGEAMGEARRHAGAAAAGPDGADDAPAVGDAQAVGATLFVAALRATVELMLAAPPPWGRAPPDALRRRGEWRAATLETLMVAWLDDAVHALQAHGLVPCDAEVELRRHDGAWCLRAEQALVPLALERHGWLGEIKAVTYHDLRVGPLSNSDPSDLSDPSDPLGGAPERWRARVILDV